MYNPNDPKKKRPQPPPSPAESPVILPPLEEPSVQQRMLAAGATPPIQPVQPVPMQPRPDFPVRPRTDVYRPEHLDRPSEQDPLTRARGDYIAPGRDVIGEEMAAPRRGWKQTLRTAGLGALQGLASGGLGGAIGGAVAGGVLGTVSPKAARGYEFETFMRPGIEREQQRQAGLQQSQLEALKTQAEIARLGADVNQRNLELEYLPQREARAEATARAQQKYYEGRAASALRPPTPPTPAAPRLIETIHPETGKPVQMFVNPQEGQQYPVYERPRVSSGGGGGGGNAEFDGDRRKQAQRDFDQVRKLKIQAQTAWGKATATEDPAQRGLASGAQQAYNDAARDLLRTYPDIFSGGAAQSNAQTGDLGWAFVEPKQRPQRPQR